MKKSAMALLALLIIVAISGAAAAQPSITITSHHEAQTVKDSSITLRGTASGSAGIVSVNVSLNRGSWQAASNASISAPQNATWSIPLQLQEGANIIVVNVTDAENASAQQTILINYQVGSPDNSGVLLAAGVVVLVVIMIVILAIRPKKAPPPQDNAEGGSLEKRLEGMSGKVEMADAGEKEEKR